jgi:hypothetical protein
MNIMINTLEFAEAFETAGFGHDQAKALAVAFGKSHEAGREDLVTTAHLDARLAELETRIVQAIADQNVSLTQAIADQNVSLTQAIADQNVSLMKAIADQNVSLTKAISEVGKDLNGRLWSTVAIIAGVSTAISATIGAGMVMLLRSGGL